MLVKASEVSGRWASPLVMAGYGHFALDFALDSDVVGECWWVGSMRLAGRLEAGGQIHLG